MAIKQTAMEFFDACETGKGWDECKQWCRNDATFSAQTDMLAEVTTLEVYTDWMRDLYVPMPDARYEVLAFAVDEERKTAIGAAIFHATHTGEGGPVPPTGKAVAADYCYVMKFDGDKIAHMSKIWNDNHSVRQIGWA
jgi:ketosteroid isomerase-like protein